MSSQTRDLEVSIVFAKPCCRVDVTIRERSRLCSDLATSQLTGSTETSSRR